MSTRDGRGQIAAGLAMLFAIAALCAAADVLSGADPLATSGRVMGLPPLSAAHPLGTDMLGRDLLAGLLHGGRVSLAVGLGVTAIALLVGVSVGAAAALGPRWLDALLMRLVDLVVTLPLMMAVIALRSVFEPSLWLVILPLGAFGWMWTARITRARVASIAESGYVRAAIGSGSTPLRALVRHILPNALAPVLASASLVMAMAISTEATLSFFGLGVPASMPSWGTSLAFAHREMLAGRWWPLAWPMLAIATTIVATNLIADGLSRR